MVILLFPLIKNDIRSRDVATMAFSSFACPKRANIENVCDLEAKKKTLF